MKKTDEPDELRKLGVLYENLQDDIQKILEIVTSQQESINKIPRMSEQVEQLEYDSSTIKLATRGTNDDLRLIKIRTEKLEELIKQFKEHEARIVELEASR